MNANTKLIIKSLILGTLLSLGIINVIRDTPTGSLVREIRRLDKEITTREENAFRVPYLLLDSAYNAQLDSLYDLKRYKEYGLYNLRNK